MRRVLPLAVAAVASFASVALAVIQTPTPLKQLVDDAQYVFIAKTESVDTDKATMIANIDADLKDKAAARRLPVVLKGITNPKTVGYIPNVTKRFAADSKSVWFLLPLRGKVITARVYSEGTWMTLTGTVDGERTVWRLSGGEPFLRGTFKGTSAELEQKLRDHFEKKTPLPDVDEKEKAGYGPELAPKSSRLIDRIDRIEASPAVIPMIAVGGPLAILALLFPTVFGGVLILFRQWTAFITLLSVNGTLLLVHWIFTRAWPGHLWLHGTWLEPARNVWIVMTVVALLCTIWAWRRQLANLASGADALDTPGRTELLVLTILTSVCGLVVLCYPRFLYAWMGDDSPPDFGTPWWDMTLSLTAGLVVGLVYKLYRSSVEVMIPMATEGVMLGTALLVHVLILTQFAGASATTGVAGAGEKWRVAPTDKERGLLVSPPLIVDGKVIAAASLPAYKAGSLVCYDLATGEKKWDFIDDGTFKQVFSAPTVGDGKIYIGEGFHEDPDCKVYAIDLETGKKVWERETTSQTESSPTHRGGKIYTGAGNDGFLCLDAGKGDVVWQFPPKDSKGRLLRFGAGAALDGPHVFAGTGVDRLQEDDKGETALFCLDAETGKQVWKTPMPEAVWAAPIVKRDRVIVAVGNGDVFRDDEKKPAGSVIALDASTGTIVWKRDLPNSVLQKPAVLHDLVYVGCRDGRCYAIDIKNGDIRWSRDLDSPVIASPVIAGSAVYAVSSHGQLACMNAATGKLVSLKTLWTAPPERPDLEPFFGAPPAIHDADGVRTIVIGGGDAKGSTPPVLICIEDRDVVR
jgi:outer membrane protein assembly factor BamB